MTVRCDARPGWFPAKAKQLPRTEEAHAIAASRYLVVLALVACSVALPACRRSAPAGTPAAETVVGTWSPGPHSRARLIVRSDHTGVYEDPESGRVPQRFTWSGGTTYARFVGIHYLDGSLQGDGTLMVEYPANGLLNRAFWRRSPGAG